MTAVLGLVLDRVGDQPLPDPLTATDDHAETDAGNRGRAVRTVDHADGPCHTGEGWRTELFESHVNLARALARRFRRGGRHPIDDLTQVALVGLLKAVGRFEPDRGTAFSTFAVPTILGELKRFLRDESWVIRPPRHVHDIYMAVEASVDGLTQILGRNPTIDELAMSTGISVEGVIQSMEAAAARNMASLDANDEGASRHGFQDEGLARVEASAALADMFQHLSDEDARVVSMRFGGDMTQSEIARALGRSQMSISRSLDRSVNRMRAMAARTFLE